MEGLLTILPILAAGLYWWFARGRPMGLVYVFLAAAVPAAIIERLAGSPAASPAVAWLVSIGMLSLARRLPRKQSPGSKTCPACAEDVKSQAQVCKHCGHTFSEPVSRAKSACLVALFVAVGTTACKATASEDTSKAVALDREQVAMRRVGGAYAERIGLRYESIDCARLMRYGLSSEYIFQCVFFDKKREPLHVANCLFSKNKCANDEDRYRQQ